MEWTDVSEVGTASIIKVIEISETSVHSNETTWLYIPEDLEL
jgi:hypothetical protein